MPADNVPPAARCSEDREGKHRSLHPYRVDHDCGFWAALSSVSGRRPLRRRSCIRSAGHLAEVAAMVASRFPPPAGFARGVVLPLEGGRTTTGAPRHSECPRSHDEGRLLSNRAEGPCGCDCWPGLRHSWGCGDRSNPWSHLSYGIRTSSSGCLTEVTLAGQDQWSRDSH